MTKITLFKPNELIATIGKLKLDRVARHLGNYFIEHAQKKIKFENYQGNTFHIKVKDLNVLADINSKDYKQIANSINNLQQTVSIRSRDNNRIMSIVMFPEIGIDLNNNEYYFALSPTTIELLKNSDFFTKLELKEMNQLDSKHSLVIFELLKRYENSPLIPIMTLDELRKITDTLDKKSYDNFTNFEKNVLKIAQKEINDKTQYNVSYELKKTSARTRFKVSEIQFYFAKKTRLEKEQAIDSEFNDELFLNFRQIFKNLPVEDYCHACETFERSTLVRFLNDLKKKNYGTLKTECFLRYLIERTNQKWNGYLYKTQNKTPKEKDPGHASGSFGANENYNFEEYLKKQRQKFFDV